MDFSYIGVYRGDSAVEIVFEEERFIKAAFRNIAIMNVMSPLCILCALRDLCVKSLF